jgi:hypothetical protein
VVPAPRGGPVAVGRLRDERAVTGRTLRRAPLRVELPGSSRRAERLLAAPLTAVPYAAHVVLVVVPAVMVVLGLAMAIGGAVLEDRDGTEAMGALGVELGAAIWFGGTLTLGARRRPTVARGVFLGLLALSGLALIAAALVGGWDGAALTLAMEFGVGAVAVAAIDVVLLGVLYGALESIAGGTGPQVVVRLGSSWHLVEVRVEPAGPSQA